MKEGFFQHVTLYLCLSKKLISCSFPRPDHGRRLRGKGRDDGVAKEVLAGGAQARGSTTKKEGAFNVHRKREREDASSFSPSCSDGRHLVGQSMNQEAHKERMMREQKRGTIHSLL